MNSYYIMAAVFLGISAHAAPPAATVLSAVATSVAPESVPISCLLDSDCRLAHPGGFWSPGSADSGVDEGIYVRFAAPIHANSIQVILSQRKPFEAAPLTLSFNGKEALGLHEAHTNDPEKHETVLIFSPGDGGDAGVSKLKSFFLKITKNMTGGTDPKPAAGIKIKAVQFFDSGSHAIPLALPKTIPATIAASSVLNPQTAYGPANLFDSKEDSAWSTDGKKNDGVGEFLTLKLGSKQTIAGFMIWNGYQRSETHFKANGRVAKLRVTGDGGRSESLDLKDSMGPQTVRFSQPFQDASQLTLTIEAVAPGTKYKDVQLSEMRLIGDDGGIILPAVQSQRLDVPAGWKPLIDRSFIMLSNPADSSGAGCSPLSGRIRIRSNGTFVIYKPAREQPRNAKVIVSKDVMEGNWEAKGDSLRIFGKRYPTTIQTAGYLNVAEVSLSAAIFQSDLTVKPNGDEKFKTWSLPAYDIDSSVLSGVVVPTDAILCAGGDDE